MRRSALLLDLDGTMVDSEPLQRAGYQAFFDGRGWTAPDLSIFTGRRAEDVFAVEPGPWSAADHGVLADEIRGLVPRDAPPGAVPGAREAVQAAAAAGIPVAIVTSARPDWVTMAVGRGLDILHLIDLVVTAEDVTDGKPDPAGFLLACSRLGVDPGAALAVEDSPAGVRAAVAARVGLVVAVTTSRTPEELTDAGAHVVHPDLRGLPDLLT